MSIFYAVLFLIQDMFPITEEYIEREYTIAGNHLMLTRKILSAFPQILQYRHNVRLCWSEFYATFQHAYDFSRFLRIITVLKIQVPEYTG